MNIAIASTEFESIIKTGGLGDAIYGISNALSKYDEFNVCVILPNFKNVDDKDFKNIGQFKIANSKITADEDLEKIGGNFLFKKIGNIDVYLIDNEYYFNREKLYGYDDDLLRWSFFSRSIYELIKQESINPDIIHTNDYHEGLLSFISKNKGDMNCKHVVSIHNAYFQGHYQFNETNSKSLFEYYIDDNWDEDDINLLRVSVFNADYVLTVSPDYAESIKYTNFGEGLEDLYCEKNAVGFLNGLDTSTYDRLSDDFESFVKVKEKYKLKLQERFNLKVDKDIPLFAYICRLSYQKGSHIILEAIKDIVENGQLIVLGTGDEGYDEQYAELNGKLDNYIAIIDFDSQLANEIYIASDMFLMPSFFEPCGISQLISQYHACLPIVTNVGGLKDSIIEYDLENANGFKLNEFGVEELVDTINTAKDVYFNDKEKWLKLMKNAYNTDNSWEKRIENYVNFYKEIGDNNA
ncbi:glycogen synthase [Methanobrevibacter sp.]|uniref:glycogen synthase n=1 Tax=Methanobrevibacter sp. TaxID=66852 RepID=UPI00388E50DF